MRDPMQVPSMYEVQAYRPKDQSIASKLLNLPIDLFLRAFNDEPAADDSRALAGEIRTLESDGFSLFGAYLRTLLGFLVFAFSGAEFLLHVDLVKAGENTLTAHVGATGIVAGISGFAGLFGFGRPPEDVTLIATVSALWALIPPLLSVVITTRKKAWRLAILDLRHQSLEVHGRDVYLKTDHGIAGFDAEPELLYPDPQPRRMRWLRKMRME